MRESFLGLALGTAVGDALGKPVEGWPRDLIRRRFGVLKEMLDGRYSDDTEMTIGIMEALLDNPDFSPTKAAKRFRENFTPSRGYGLRTALAIRKLQQGVPWESVSFTLMT